MIGACPWKLLLLQNDPHAESEERVAHMISYTAKDKEHQNPCGNFSDTPSLRLREIKIKRACTQDTCDII